MKNNIIVFFYPQAEVQDEILSDQRRLFFQESLSKIVLSALESDQTNSERKLFLRLIHVIIRLRDAGSASSLQDSHLLTKELSGVWFSW